MELIVFGILIIPGISYFLISAAVKEGVYKALVEYDKYKDEKLKEHQHS